MQVFRGIPEQSDSGCVLTIGNFDGVHRGHQALLAKLSAKAKAHGLPAAVLTFEPHPREYFTHEDRPRRLTSLREKIELLRAQGVDRLYIGRFNARLAGLTADEFIQRVLIQGLDVRHLMIGDDFRFGQGRKGDFALLQQAGAARGFGVEAMDTLVHEGERVSSSAVRNALAAGEMEHAARLLGRPYSISGRVMHGDKIGRTIGFPTCNIQLKHRSPPMMGIYTVSVEGLAEHPWPGVASIGVRPTINDAGRTTLEVHLFDWTAECYDAHLKVNFLAKQRDEARYDTLEALTAQIARDADEARAHFARNPL
jgi:riboflavin kinase / FMN adenylyltransferase